MRQHCQLKTIYQSFGWFVVGRHLDLLDELIAMLLNDLEERAGVHPVLVHNAGYVTLVPDLYSYANSKRLTSRLAGLP